MKKAYPDGMRPEYCREDLGRGVWDKYLNSLRSGTNLALLQPDVAKAFPTDEAVNGALRSFMDAEEGSVDAGTSSG